MNQGGGDLVKVFKDSREGERPRNRPALHAWIHYQSIGTWIGV